MKFAHLGDCHLGGWRQPELKELNFLSFQEAISRCLQNKVEFVLISGDLFDSAYPPIETLKQTFDEFRKLKEANIPVFLIAGSHDYSVSGKTFLDVLEKAGFARNVFRYEERENQFILQPTIYNNCAIYGYPGKKSGLEVDEIERIKLNDSPGLFKILMLHTTIKDAVGNTPIKAVDESSLPEVDYLALSHLHINYNKKNRVYSGPTFPNNLSELEELHHGFFQIYNNGKITKQELKLKEVIPIHLEISNSLSTTESIIFLLKTHNLINKIVIVRVSGILEKGKIMDIDFNKIESFLKEQKAYAFLKSTTKLHIKESEIKLDSITTENVEEKLFSNFVERNPSKFNYLIQGLMNSLMMEKLEDETISSYEDRLLSETNRALQI